MMRILVVWEVWTDPESGHVCVIVARFQNLVRIMHTPIGKFPAPLQPLKGHITVSEIGTETCHREDIVITARICHINSEGSAAVLPPFQYVIMYVNPF